MSAPLYDAAEARLNILIEAAIAALPPVPAPSDSFTERLSFLVRNEDPATIGLRYETVIEERREGYTNIRQKREYLLLTPPAPIPTTGRSTNTISTVTFV